MRTVKIPKGFGQFRTIYVPDERETAQLRAHLGDLESIMVKVCHPYCIHGFWPGRSPTSNAWSHVGYTMTLSMDLKDFFDTVNFDKVYRVCSPDREGNNTLPNCWRDAIMYPAGAARQGLPTSPLLANIAAADMDKDILGHCHPRGIAYTRYADDLTFSMQRYTEHNTSYRGFDQMMGAIVRSYGFQVNERKTRWQYASAGRRHVTGVGVGENGIYPTRESKRKLRAAIHRNPGGLKARGLFEWCLCKFPKAHVKDLERLHENMLKQIEGSVG